MNEHVQPSAGEISLASDEFWCHLLQEVDVNETVRKSAAYASLVARVNKLVQEGRVDPDTLEPVTNQSHIRSA